VSTCYDPACPARRSSLPDAHRRLIQLDPGGPRGRRGFGHPHQGPAAGSSTGGTWRSTTPPRHRPRGSGARCWRRLPVGAASWPRSRGSAKARGGALPPGVPAAISAVGLDMPVGVVVAYAHLGGSAVAGREGDPMIAAGEEGGGLLGCLDGHGPCQRVVVALFVLYLPLMQRPPLVCNVPFGRRCHRAAPVLEMGQLQAQGLAAPPGVRRAQPTDRLDTGGADGARRGPHQRAGGVGRSASGHGACGRRGGTKSPAGKLATCQHRPVDDSDRALLRREFSLTASRQPW
jgi:hypothetical protein